jgi:hypothetical protein
VDARFHGFIRNLDLRVPSNNAAPQGRNFKMGQLDKDGILTLQELMITALATADVVAKLLIDKGLVSQKEYDVKLFSERASYQALLQRVEGMSVDS